jgi:hypothetical protein
MRLHTTRVAHAHPRPGSILRDLLSALWPDQRSRKRGGDSMTNPHPKSTCELRPAEHRFLEAMQELGYGRFEHVWIAGELVLEPWPATIRSVKFGNPTPNRPPAKTDFELKDRIAEFFAHVRRVDAGEILLLEIRGGLPFAMEVLQDASPIQF